MKSLVVLAGLLTAACTADLHVYEVASDGTATEVEGVPFRGAEVWVQQGVFGSHTKQGGNCEPAAFVEYITLATGQLYYAEADPGPLADSEFSVTFNDAGGVKQVQLNSDSNLAENVSAANELAATVLPFIGAPQYGVAAAGATPACNTGKQVQSFLRLEDWISQYGG